MAVVLLSSTLVPSLSASGVTMTRVSATVPSTLAANLPVLRLHFSVPTKARKLPALVIRPALATQWQQIGPRDVQAVATSSLHPSTTYTFNTPTLMRCAKTCAFTATRPRVASVSTNLTWEAQLLAELNYLPLTFTLGTDNIVLQGALRTFQSQSNIPVTGEAGATTWSDLLSAVNANRVDPATYNY